MSDVCLWHSPLSWKPWLAPGFKAQCVTVHSPIGHTHRDWECYEGWTQHSIGSVHKPLCLLRNKEEGVLPLLFCNTLRMEGSKRCFPEWDDKDWVCLLTLISTSFSNLYFSPSLVRHRCPTQVLVTLLILYSVSMGWASMWSQSRKPKRIFKGWRKSAVNNLFLLRMLICSYCCHRSKNLSDIECGGGCLWPPRNSISRSIHSVSLDSAKTFSG